MTLDELLTLARAFASGDSPEWTAATENILEALSLLASERRIVEIAEAYHLLIDAHPTALPFFRCVIPSLVVAHYPPMTHVNRTPGFQRWCAAHPGWLENLSASLVNPTRFAQAVDAIVDDATPAPGRT
jgi:hypothetical protein